MLGFQDDFLDFFGIVMVYGFPDCPAPVWFPTGSLRSSPCEQEPIKMLNTKNVVVSIFIF